MIPEGILPRFDRQLPGVQHDDRQRVPVVWLDKAVDVSAQQAREKQMLRVHLGPLGGVRLQRRFS